MILAAIAAASLAGCVRQYLDAETAARNPDLPPYMQACDIYPPGWRPMSEAPRDGTVIETRNAWGLRASYTLSRWTNVGGSAEKGWVDAWQREECTERSTAIACGVVYAPWDSEPGMAWRPFNGDPQTYDWCGRNPAIARYLEWCKR